MRCRRVASIRCDARAEFRGRLLSQGWTGNVYEDSLSYGVYSNLFRLSCAPRRVEYSNLFQIVVSTVYGRTVAQLPYGVSALGPRLKKSTSVKLVKHKQQEHAHHQCSERTRLTVDRACGSRNTNRTLNSANRRAGELAVTRVYS